WIGENAAALVDVGSLQERAGNKVAAAERRLCAELLEDELLDRVVENAEAGADARFAGAANECAEQTVFPVWTPVEPETRREAFVVGVGQRAGNVLVTRKNE